MLTLRFTSRHAVDTRSTLREWRHRIESTRRVDANMLYQTEYVEKTRCYKHISLGTWSTVCECDTWVWTLLSWLSKTWVNLAFQSTSMAYIEHLSIESIQKYRILSINHSYLVSSKTILETRFPCKINEISKPRAVAHHAAKPWALGYLIRHVAVSAQRSAAEYKLYMLCTTKCYFIFRLELCRVK